MGCMELSTNYTTLESRETKPKIALIATIPFSIKVFLFPHIEVLAKDFDIVIMTAKDDTGCFEGLLSGVEFKPFPIVREISLIDDIKSLYFLYKALRQENVSIVHSITPKAGLLTMLAGRFARVPNRLHTFTGQVWATQTGIMRRVLKYFDRIIVSSSSLVLADSISQRLFLEDQKVVPRNELMVLGDGCLNGVDCKRFFPDRRQRDETRRALSLNNDDFLILYLGRIKKEKGVLDLAQAFVKIKRKIKNATLVFVGPDEENLESEIRNTTALFQSDIRFVPYTAEPEYFMMAADVFCMPSYREGFGSVIVEAAACNVPSVASRVYGLTDAIAEGETGLMHTAGNIDELTEAIVCLAEDHQLRESLGAAARRRSMDLFSQERISKEWRKLYIDLLT